MTTNAIAFLRTLKAHLDHWTDEELRLYVTECINEIHEAKSEEEIRSEYENELQRAMTWWNSLTDEQKENAERSALGSDLDPAGLASFMSVQKPRN